MNRPFKCRLAAAMLVCPLLLTASCRPAEPSGSSLPPVPSQSASSQSVSSAELVSSQSVSSGTVSQIPLALSFDKGVYVNRFHNDGYLNENNQWVSWEGSSILLADNAEYVVKGAYQDFYFKGYNGSSNPFTEKPMSDSYFESLFQALDGVVQCPCIYEGNFGPPRPYGLKPNGAVIMPLEYEDMEPTAFRKAMEKHLSEWRDVVYIVIDCGVWGLKSQGDIVFEPNLLGYDQKAQLESHPFKDIVMIASSGPNGTHFLRKDGALLNEKQEVVYENVVRLFDSGSINIESLAVLADGRVIGLNEMSFYGYVYNLEDIVEVRKLEWGIYALKKDGSFQTVWYDKSDANQAEQAERMAQVTDCKTT